MITWDENKRKRNILEHGIDLAETVINVSTKPTFKTSSFSVQEIEAMIGAAPDQVDDPDCPYDTNDPEAFKAYWAQAKTILPGQHAFQKAERLKLKKAKR